jgi:hypothetical protein
MAAKAFPHLRIAVISTLKANPLPECVWMENFAGPGTVPWAHGGNTP